MVEAKLKLDPLALAIAAAIIAAIIMLVLGILGNLGVYMGAVRMMEEAHIFFDLTPVGIITGMIEAAVITFIFAYPLGWLYNVLAGRKV
jgi:hypothetical protein